jgi:hypothetical protein
LQNKTPDYGRVLHNYSHLSPRRTIWKHSTENTTARVGGCHMVSSVGFIHQNCRVTRIAPLKATEDAEFHAPAVQRKQEEHHWKLAEHANLFVSPVPFLFRGGMI